MEMAVSNINTGLWVPSELHSIAICYQHNDGSLRNLMNMNIGIWGNPYNARELYYAISSCFTIKIYIEIVSQNSQSVIAYDCI